MLDVECLMFDIGLEIFNTLFRTSICHSKKVNKFLHLQNTPKVLKAKYALNTI